LIPHVRWLGVTAIENELQYAGRPPNLPPTTIDLENALPAFRLAVFAAFAVLAAPLSTPRADEPPVIQLTLKDHRFVPAEVHVPSGKAVILRVTNEDDTADEFDSTALKVEKVIVAKGYGLVRLRPLSPGRYPFMGEFHPDTAQGVVIAE
jgi:Cupredoxin-like domain